jgi:hypothetical protein
VKGPLFPFPSAPDRLRLPPSDQPVTLLTRTLRSSYHLTGFRQAAILSVLTLAIGATTDAWAYDFEVNARTEAYGYQLRRYGRDGVSLLSRRRVTQYLGLRLFNLLESGRQAHSSSDPTRPPALIYAQGLMRFFSDFGDFTNRLDEVPELENDEFELLLGSIEGRNLWGYVDFSLGRQYDAELMDFFAYDGLRLRANAPWGMFVEGYAGFQVDRSTPFAAAVFELDGTSGSSPHDDAFAPSFGIAAGIDDSDLLELRVAYRAVISRADVMLDADGTSFEPRWGRDQEVLFVHIALPAPRWGSRVTGALRYNMLTNDFDELQFGLSQRFGPRHLLSLDVLRSRPHFDGDSIFNIFALEPFSELAGSYRVELPASFWITLRGGYRWFWSTPEDPDAQTGAYSAGLLSGWSHQRARVDLELFALGGYGGDRFGADLGGLWSSPRWLFGRRITLDGRISLIRLSDAASRLGSLTTLSLQAGAEIRLLPQLRLHLMVEDNISRLYDSAFRVLGLLDMSFAP